MSNDWKVVPVEPTDEMNKAGMRWLTGFQHMRANDKRNALTEAFKAMVSDAPQPPALGGEPEILAWMYKRHDQSPFGKPSQHIAISSENLTEVREGLVGVGIPCDNHFDWRALVDRAHVARLSAENADLIEARDSRVTERLAVLDKLNARAAELERVLGIVEDTLPHISGESRTVSSLLFTVQQALAEGKCCTATAEEQQLLASGEYTPEEIFGTGGKPSCPKCHGQKAVPGASQEPGKPCAAEWQGHQCSAPRAEDSLFCPQHRSVDARQCMGGDPLTNEQLAFMMQRDGEIQ